MTPREIIAMHVMAALSTDEVRTDEKRMAEQAVKRADALLSVLYRKI